MPDQHAGSEQKLAIFLTQAGPSIVVGWPFPPAAVHDRQGTHREKLPIGLLLR